MAYDTTQHSIPLASGGGVLLDQTDVIREEIPAAIDAAIELSGQTRLYIIAHSWGGVLVAARKPPRRSTRRSRHG